MHFRKTFSITLALIAGFALCDDPAEAKEIALGLELRTSQIDRVPTQRVLSSTAHDKSAPVSSVAQVTGGEDVAIRNLEARGFQNISGLVRRGDNFIAQARDPNGVKVRVVMNARTGEIVGLSRILKKK